jgi:hypothetical protein
MYAECSVPDWRGAKESPLGEAELMNCRQILSELFSTVCKLLRIKSIKTSAYRPQTNGILERTHRVLVEYLRCYILDNQTDWDCWIS